MGKRLDWLDCHIIETTASSGAKFRDTIRAINAQVVMHGFNITRHRRIGAMWQAHIDWVYLCIGKQPTNGSPKL